MASRIEPIRDGQGARLHVAPLGQVNLHALLLHADEKGTLLNAELLNPLVEATRVAHRAVLLHHLELVERVLGRRI